MYTFDPDWLAKLDALRDAGQDPYPNGFVVTNTSADIHERFDDVEDPTTAEGSEGLAVGGRVLFRNRMGKAIFLRIQDRGGIIQAYCRREEVGDDTFAMLRNLDIGDFLWVRGNVMRTRTGETTLRGQACSFAGKILMPFPDRHHSVTDVELRTRQRYVDLFMNEETRETFRQRSQIVRFIRTFFEEREFIEVETPMLQPIPGGAAARPFVTHHNTLDMPLYLRIAPELYLKRLVVGGLDRVFEINRSFRNEGISIKHNPEFTMLEFYQAWATYKDLMDLTEELMVGLVDEIRGERVFEFGEHTLDFNPPFRRADMDELIAEHAGIPREDLEDPAKIEAWYRSTHNVAEEADLPTIRGKWWEHLFDEYVEHQLINPTFVTGFPTEISPLSRRNDDDPSRVDRFEVVCATWELANAFSELNDPVDQAGRFADQAKQRTEGDEESMYFDGDYVRALSYGMPPTAGEGIGIDRLVMLLTGRTSIREVILFPTLRSER